MILPESLKRYIEESCEVDEISGDLVCKKCGSRVIVDWFEKTLECQGCDDI